MRTHRSKLDTWFFSGLLPGSLLLIAWLHLPSTTFGQHVLSPSFSYGPLSSINNPALGEYEGMFFTLPTFAFNYGNNAFAYSDLIDRSDKGNPVLSPERAIQNLRDNNKIQLQLDLDFFRLGIRRGPVFFGFSASEKIDIQFDYKKELGLLAWHGNEQYIGRNVEIGPALNGNYYREFALNIGAEVKGHRFGARFKYLTGLANLRTDINSALIYTDTLYYQLSLTTDYQVSTSGIENFIKDPVSSFLTSGNPGMSVDLGYSGKIKKLIDIDVSIINLGYINWQINTKTYRSKDSFTFEGVELSEYFEIDTFFLESLIDSLKSSFKPTTTTGNYRSTLSPIILLGAHYSIADRTKAGILLNAKIFDGLKPAVSIYIQHRLKKVLEAGVSYTFKGNSFDHIGVNLGLKFGKFRFDLFTDELYNLIRLDRARYANFRLGLTVTQ